MDSKKRKKMLSFEEALQKLEAIVQSLEQGEVPLELLIEKYKEGLVYQKCCQQQLDRASLVLKTLADEESEMSATRAQTLE